MTRAEILAHVPPLTERRLETYINRRLVPKTTRSGLQEPGTWPKVALELVALVHAADDRAIPFGSIRELAEVWMFLKGAARDGVLPLEELETLLGELAPATLLAVPWVVQHVMSAPGGGARPTLRLQSGDELAPDAAVTIRLTVRGGPDEPAHPLSEVVIALGGGDATAVMTVAHKTGDPMPGSGR